MTDVQLNWLINLDDQYDNKRKKKEIINGKSEKSDINFRYNVAHNMRKILHLKHELELYMEYWHDLNH